MATIISVSNPKGSQGKTTTAINLACSLSAKGYSVIVYDLDSVMSTLSQWYKRRKVRIKEEGEKREALAKVQNTPEEKNVEKELGRPLDMEFIEVRGLLPGMLADTIQEHRASNSHEIVILDCPGMLNDVTESAVKESDAVLCPVIPRYADVEGSKALLRIITRAQEMYPETRFLLFLNLTEPGRIELRTARQDLENQFKMARNTKVVSLEFPNLVAISRFIGTGLSIFEAYPNSREAGLYTNLTEEVIACLSQSSQQV